MDIAGLWGQRHSTAYKAALVSAMVVVGLFIALMVARSATIEIFRFVDALLQISFVVFMFFCWVWWTERRFRLLKLEASGIVLTRRTKIATWFFLGEIIVVTAEGLLAIFWLPL